MERPLLPIWSRRLPSLPLNHGMLGMGPLSLKEADPVMSRRSGFHKEARASEIERISYVGMSLAYAVGFWCIRLEWQESFHKYT